MIKKIFRILRYDLPLFYIILLTNLFPDLIFFLKLRGFLVRPFLGKCGKNFMLGRNVTFYNPKNIFIGNNVYIAYGNWFSANDSIIVGDDVLIGPYNVFTSSNHTKENSSFRWGKSKKAKIVIESGTWIGAQCSILAGSYIQKGCLIAAGSVVKGKTESNSLYAGVPAKKVKTYE